MDDLKKLSVERLRELARTHLGKGHSRLRNKTELLAALKDVLREPLARLVEAAESVVPHRREKVRVVEFPPGRKGRERTARAPASSGSPSPAPTARTAEAARAPARASGRPVERPTSADAPASPRTPEPASRRRADPAGRQRVPGTPEAGKRSSTRAGAVAETGPRSQGRSGPRIRELPQQNGAPLAPSRQVPRAPPPPPASPVDLPVEERFFDAPATPRRPRRTPAPTDSLEREPFASPREVGTDAPVLLVRDPNTLFLFWDFRRELERGAALGLREPRLLLRLYRGAGLDRTLELPLSTRSTYVGGLTSGQEYTAEVLLLGRDGWTRPVGGRSAVRRLPPGRVSTQLEVRMLRLPWSESLSGAPAPSAPSAPRDEPLDSPRRVPLPTSPGAQGPGAGSGPSRGPRSGRN